MLTPHKQITHTLVAMFIMFFGINLVLWACAAAVDSPNLHDGAEYRNFEHLSTRLNTSTGQRLELSLLAASPPLGLPSLPTIPKQAAIDLGRRLFFDRRLSANGTLSCGMCHIPEQGFAQNELATPVGIEGRSVRRNAPTLYNVAYVKALFHDGRESQLDRQIWEPLLAINEMGNTSRTALIERTTLLEDYAEAFAKIYAAGLTEETLGMALASYQRALLSGESKFDRWYYQDDAQSLNHQEQQGFEIFKRQGCITCHTVEAQYALFSNGQYYNTGIGYRAHVKDRQPKRVQLAPGVFVKPTIVVEVLRMSDLGRFEVTADEADRWRYRTPSLRNVALTAPYMHDGSLATLSAVIDYYDSGGSRAPNQDPRIKPQAFKTHEKTALLAFLRTLTGSNVKALAADARSVPIGDEG